MISKKKRLTKCKVSRMLNFSAKLVTSETASMKITNWRMRPKRQYHEIAGKNFAEKDSIKEAKMEKNCAE